MSDHRAQPHGRSRRRKWGVAFLLITLALLALHVVTFFVPSGLNFWVLLAGGPPLFAALLLSVILLAPPITGRLWDVAPATFCLVILVLHLLTFVVFGATGMVFFFLTGATLLLAVPISLVVLLVGIVIRRRLTRHQWTARLVLLGVFCVVFLALRASYVPTVSWCSDVGVRLRVSQGGGVDALQTWAVQILDTPEGERPLNEMDHIREDALPPDIRALGPRSVYVSGGRGGPDEEHVAIIWGGGFHHWGIFVGRPTFRTRSDEHQQVFCWREGIYGYHEIQ